MPGRPETHARPPARPQTYPPSCSLEKRRLTKSACETLSRFWNWFYPWLGACHVQLTPIANFVLRALNPSSFALIALFIVSGQTSKVWGIQLMRWVGNAPKLLLFYFFFYFFFFFRNSPPRRPESGSAFVGCRGERERDEMR